MTVVDADLGDPETATGRQPVRTAARSVLVRRCPDGAGIWQVRLQPALDASAADAALV